MNHSSTAIEQALLDVRKAYRLLHDYQRMVMDGVDYIGKQLGLTYYGGWPKFSDPTPRPGKGGLHGYWAWDWLNMMEYDFHFGCELDNDQRILVSMLLISDTGFFCSEQENLEATDVTGFLPPERSQTKIGFVMSAKNWRDLEFSTNKDEMKTFIETGGGLPEDHVAEGIVAKCYDLSRLMDEDSTNALIDELVSFAKASGVPLKRVGH